MKITSGIGKTYVTGGLNPGYLLNAQLGGGEQDVDVKKEFEAIDLSAVFGFGVMLPIGKPLLTMELHHEQGILNAIASPIFIFFAASIIVPGGRSTMPAN